MVQNTNEEVAHCLHYAADARALAKNTANQGIQRGFLSLETNWTLLSSSEEFAGRLERIYAGRRALTGTARASALHSNVGRVQAKLARNALIATVDDDPWACEGMNSFVVSLGYRGVTFLSAEEYLASELKQRTRCLILDVHLGGMSGPDLQARLLADGYCIPVIFVTAQFEEHVRSRVMETGALGYLTKPCDETTLLKYLKQAVGE